LALGCMGLALLGCGSGDSSSVNDSGAEASDAFTGVEPSPDAGPGGYVMITGTTGSTPLAGTYTFLLATGGSVGCGGTGVVEFTAAAMTGEITVQVIGVALAAGQTATTPKAKIVLQLGTLDDGTYPTAGQGTCSVTDQSGNWPTQVDSIFECTSLIGVGSGQRFNVSGYLNCPNR